MSDHDSIKCFGNFTFIDSIDVTKIFLGESIVISHAIRITTQKNVRGRTILSVSISLILTMSFLFHGSQEFSVFVP